MEVCLFKLHIVCSGPSVQQEDRQEVCTQCHIEKIHPVCVLTGGPRSAVCARQAAWLCRAAGGITDRY